MHNANLGKHETLFHFDILSILGALLVVQVNPDST